jgi:hypothetical protein
MTTLPTLESLARAATPGPWHDEYRSQDGYSVWSDAGMRLVAGYASSFDKANAAYIAALSPERVLALIAVVRAADAMLKAGVSIAQRVGLPYDDDDNIHDDTALEEFISVFDGPPQRAYDIARAQLEALP